eukprot:gene36559-49261_t
MAAYENRYWWSNDGLRLHYRDYAGRADRPPIICLPGLTRNARDYASVAERLAGEWRVIAVDFRGRGESGYAKDPMSYVPLTYVQDMEALLSELGVERYVAFGTSLGGIVTMLLAGAFFFGDLFFWHLAIFRTTIANATLLATLSSDPIADADSVASIVADAMVSRLVTALSTGPYFAAITSPCSVMRMRPCTDCTEGGAAAPAHRAATPVKQLHRDACVGEHARQGARCLI